MRKQHDSPGGYNMTFLWMICLVAAMGGLLFGYDWVVIGGAKPFFISHFGLEESTNLVGWAMSSALVGCMIGAVMSGMMSDRFGRKRLLILAGLLFTASAVGTAMAGSFRAFVWLTPKECSEDIPLMSFTVAISSVNTVGRPASSIAFAMASTRSAGALTSYTPSAVGLAMTVMSTCPGSSARTP